VAVFRNDCGNKIKEKYSLLRFKNQQDSKETVRICKKQKSILRTVAVLTEIFGGFSQPRRLLHNPFTIYWSE